MEIVSSEYIFDGETLHKDKAVLLNNNMVVEIGNIETLKKAYSKATVKDMGRGVLFPGFVDVHTHLELSHLKNRLPHKADFIKWLKSMMSLKKEHFYEEIVKQSIKSGLQELIQSGVRVVGDISNTLATVEYLKRALPLSVVFFENYSLSLKKSYEIEKSLKENLGDIQLSASPLRVSAVPHSIYSTNKHLLRYLSKICQPDLPYSIHYLEHKYENSFAISKGKLFDYLSKIGLVDDELHYNSASSYLSSIKAVRNGMIFVHCVYADDKDIDFFKNIDATIGVCARSNVYISDTLPDLYKFEKSGVNIAIGTDSLASNYDLNFINELKFIRKHFPNISAQTIFKWATKGGAKALKVKLGFKKGYFAYPVFFKTSSKNPLEEILE